MLWGNHIIHKFVCKTSNIKLLTNAFTTAGHLFSRTAIFTDFANFLFYTKIVSPKNYIYARINHNHISGSP